MCKTLGHIIASASIIFVQVIVRTQMQNPRIKMMVLSVIMTSTLYSMYRDCALLTKLLLKASKGGWACQAYYNWYLHDMKALLAIGMTYLVQNRRALSSWWWNLPEYFSWIHYRIDIPFFLLIRFSSSLKLVVIIKNVSQNIKAESYSMFCYNKIDKWN